jgi:hypothetical protein
MILVLLFSHEDCNITESIPGQRKMSFATTCEWEEFRRVTLCREHPSVVAGFLLPHHQHTPIGVSSQQIPQQHSVSVIFTPACCFFGEFDELDEAAKANRLEIAAANLRQCLARHDDSANSLFQEETPCKVDVTWNAMSTRTRRSLPRPATRPTVVVVVPDRSHDDLSLLHQEMNSVASRIPTLIFDNGTCDSSCVRVMGLPSFSRIRATAQSTLQLEVGFHFVSIEFLLASLHFGCWCEPADYLLRQHENASPSPGTSSLPEWRYLRGQCPPCTSHPLDGLSKLISLAPSPSGLDSKKRIRCVNAEESLQMLRRLDALIRTELPLAPVCSVQSKECKECPDEQCTHEDKNNNDNTVIPSDDRGGWMCAQAPSLLSDRNPSIQRASTSGGWTLPPLLSKALQSFVDSAFESTVDTSSLTVSEQRVLRTVATFSSALHRCFHSYHMKTSTSGAAQCAASSQARQQPLEMVWIAIGKELGVSGHEAFTQFSSLLIQPRSSRIAKKSTALLNHEEALDSTVTFLDPLQQLRSQHNIVPLEAGASPNPTTSDPPAHCGPTRIEASSSPHHRMLDDVLRFRCALPRVDDALSLEIESLDQLLLVIQECLLGMLKESVIP